MSSALGRVKTKTDPVVYLLMQDADPSIYDFIASALYGRKDVTLIHLLCFQSANVESKEELLFNIKLCESFTPLLLCGCNYQPLCYYHSSAAVSYTHLFINNFKSEKEVNPIFLQKRSKVALDI